MLLRVFLWVLAFLALTAAGLAAHVLTATGDTVFSWKRPDNLGVKEGRLAPPKRTPNCVSSQADPSDAEHFIAPIAFTGTAAEALAATAHAVQSMQGATIIRQEGNYLYAEYRTPLMKFVDDVEFVHDGKAGVLHVRSASRLGRRDFGVNRGRVESLRARITGKPR